MQFSLLISTAVTLVDPCPPAFAAEPDETLEHLRAADDARQTDAEEAQRWAEEKARLDLLAAAIDEQIAAARRRTSAAQAKLRTLRESKPASPNEALEAGAVRVAAQIDDALDALARRVPPGLIPDRGPERADPREALDQSLHRLERAERNVETIDVSVAPGRLNGEDRSVEVVRLGGVAAWWRSLDGTAAGEAQMVDGRLRLHPVSDPETAEAIARASAIAKGRRAPEILLLPVRYARTATSGMRR